ncbi:MAG: hypothetical protein JKY56_09115 [Kofleriaceae bacterium]|nr:hypothetical protein [Kofleriaceae bacterium]
MLLAAASSAACGGDSKTSADAGIIVPDAQIGWARGIDLPEALSNNSLVGLQSEGGCMLYSMLGIDSSLTKEGVHNRAFRWREGDTQWISLPDIPGPGRLASNAVALRGEPYLLGGYELADGSTEISHTSLQRFNLRTGQWDSLADLPIAIDDAGVVAWRDRYIVVVSGWSNTANVDAVQIYDVENNTWTMGTPFPGLAVFGPSAAISGNELVFIDGVGSGFAGFSIVNQSFKATLNPESPSDIVWTDLGQHPGDARYRAAGGTASDGTLWFHGGTAEPYNFDGLRYDNNQAATPLASTLTYANGVFEVGSVDDKPTATMDHRSMGPCGERLFTVGGMSAGPAATTEVWSIVP